MNLGKPTAVAAGAILLVTAGGIGGATAGSYVTSKDIKNGTVRSVDIRNGAVRSVDIKNGTVGYRDLNDMVRSMLHAQGPRGPRGAAGVPGVDGASSTQLAPEKGDLGPAGADGRPGQDGKDGPPGAAGKDGVSGYEIVVGPDVTVGGLTTQQASASCPEGKRVIGGGLVPSGGPAFQPVIHGSYASAGGTWTVVVSDPLSVGGGTVNAQAICATAETPIP